MIPYIELTFELNREKRMTEAILNKLEVLQKDSSQHLSPVTIANSIPHSKSKLCKKKVIANANIASLVIKGASSLLQPGNRRYVEKLTTMPASMETNALINLNAALLGGKSYPVLTATLGTAAGIGSFGAGLIFAVAATGLNLAQTSQKALARTGDEIWQIEEIGKVLDNRVFSSGGYKAVHVLSYFLVDPYRHTAPRKGWLIHEDRSDITLE